MLSDFVSLPLSLLSFLFTLLDFFFSHLSLHFNLYYLLLSVPLSPSFTPTLFVSFHLMFLFLSIFYFVSFSIFPHLFSYTNLSIPSHYLSILNSLSTHLLPNGLPPTIPSLSLSIYPCHYPSSLPVTIAAVPSIRPRFPVAWLPPSPSRSLVPSLRRTAGRRCTAPPPPSPTGRGNESPRQPCTV